MKFDVYGRFQLEIVREGERWTVYNLAQGKRSVARDVVIPPEVTSGERATYLDDLFHEAATPGNSVRRL